ncbi:MAG: hydroxymethylglutaryl-CoA lyase [Deltaproteobacteria bacterium]|nr:hydroxymethylglutaryl-CoA lyase [Deltaproteobacteria bacterium]
MKLPQKIILTEVGPRDGLQNEKEFLSTLQKLEFIQKLTEAGFHQIEVASFVSPKWVPQMGDSEEIIKALSPSAAVKNICLVPNQKGLEKALELNVKNIALFTAASESFTKKNINKTIPESLKDFEAIGVQAKKNKMWVRGYVSTCFVCPYEGKIKAEKVLEVAKALINLGVDEISLGDTLGAAVPTQVEHLLKLLMPKISSDQIALHFHDTRGTALANVLTGLQFGIYRYDSSAGGLGGCPYAPGASGNLATEDLVYMLNEMGIETGIDLEKLVEASRLMSGFLKRPLTSKYLQSCTASPRK